MAPDQRLTRSACVNHVAKQKSLMQERMDWDALSFDWNHARAFLVTAELGSLSKAASALGLSQPTLSRQVEAIQQALGVVLFERHGAPGTIGVLEALPLMGYPGQSWLLKELGWAS